MRDKYVLVLRVSDPKDKGDIFKDTTERYATQEEALDAMRGYVYYAWLGRRTGIPDFDIRVYRDSIFGMKPISYTNHNYKEED